MSVKEYLSLLEVAAPHLKGILIVAYNTGMRRGEILGLQWSNMDEDAGIIRLEKDETKEGKKKSIPINVNVKKVLDNTPRALLS